MPTITATAAPAAEASRSEADAVRQRWLTAALYLMGLAIAVQLVWSTTIRLAGNKGIDFLVVYDAAQALVSGQPMYDPRRIERDLFGANFHLPPFAAVVALPFTLLGRDEALTAWRLLALAAHFGALVLLLRLLRVPAATPLAGAALVVWAFCWPARATLIEGQWDAFFLLGLSVAWWAERRGWSVLAGGALAVIGSIKPYPLLALGYFAVRRRWLALAAALGGLMLCFGLGVLVAGPRASLTFVERVVPQLGATTAYAENQSIAGFLARVIEPEFRPVAAVNPLITLLSRVLLLALLVPLGLLAWRTPREPLGRELQYAAWVAAAPLGIPASWLHYQHLLLLPLLVLAVTWWRGAARPGMVGQALYGLALVLIAFGDHYTVLGPLAGELWKPQQARVDAANAELLARFAGPAMLLVSYKLYGALLLWGLCLRAAWRSSTSAPVRRRLGG